MERQTTSELVFHDAANDPRFNTPWKRLSWFRKPGESQPEFAKRLGVSAEILNCFKIGEVDNLTLDTAVNLCKRLDVGVLWLFSGDGYNVTILPDGERRLTSIPRCRPFHQFIDSVEDNEPRSYLECYDREGVAPLTH